jgi:transposase
MIDGRTDMSRLDTDALNSLKTRLIEAQQGLATAQARVERAKEDAEKATEELRALGFDTDAPIDPQLEQVYTQTVELLEKVERGLADASRILTPTAG